MCPVLGVRLARWLGLWHRHETMAQGLAAMVEVYWSPSNSPTKSLSAIARTHSEATSSSPVSSLGLSVFAKRSIAYGPEFAGSEAGPPMRNTIARSPRYKGAGRLRFYKAVGHGVTVRQPVPSGVHWNVCSEVGVWAHVDRLRSALLHCSLALGTKRRIQSIRYAGRPVSGWRKTRQMNRTKPD